MSSGGPQVSVIVAIKNSERFLGEALASIDVQIGGDYEIVVVDGHSRDNGPSIARAHPRVTLIPQNGTGLSDAWNVGIAGSRGAFIAFLDSDDLWTPGKLAAQLAVFERAPNTDYVIGRTKFFLQPGATLPAGFRSDLLTESHLAHMPGATIIRRKVVERLGPFDTRMAIASDIPWFASLRDTANMGVVDSIVLRKRLHGTNLSSSSWPTFRRELFRVLKDRVEEGRRNGANASETDGLAGRQGGSDAG